MHTALASVLIVGGALVAGCHSTNTTPNPTRELSFASAPVAPATQDISVPVTLTFTVAETSPDDAGAANVAWTITRDSAAFQAGVIGTIVANTSQTVTTTIQETAAGSHTYVITIDSANAIAETDEGNNTATFTIDWTDATLTAIASAGRQRGAASE